MNVIFDMIGYWSAVTVITITLFYGVFILGTLSLDKWIENISEGKSKKTIKSKLPKVLRYGQTIEVALSTTLSCFCIFMVLMSGVDIRLSSTSYIELVNNLSLLLTPFFSWVTSTLIGLYIIHVVAKRGYKLTQAVKELERKSKQ